MKLEQLRKEIHDKLVEKYRDAAHMKLKCRAMVENELGKLLPAIREADLAIQMYDKTPSIRNGAKRHDAEERARFAIQDTSELLWMKYHAMFSDFVTEDEMTEMIAQTLRILRPEGEF